MEFIKQLKENLINDFNDYLKENNLEISVNWIVNENYINDYLMSIFYNIQDNTESIEEIEDLQDEFFEILDEYCCCNAIAGF